MLNFLILSHFHILNSFLIISNNFKFLFIKLNKTYKETKHYEKRTRLNIQIEYGQEDLKQIIIELLKWQYINYITMNEK